MIKTNVTVYSHQPALRIRNRAAGVSRTWDVGNWDDGSTWDSVVSNDDQVIKVRSEGVRSSIGIEVKNVKVTSMGTNTSVKTI